MSWRKTHFRIRYYRPRYMGGDTQHPLCQAPHFGWAGEKAAAQDMTDRRLAVTCPRCSKYLAAGGLSARRAADFASAWRKCGVELSDTRVAA
jgi:hypothetical protein